MKGGPTYRVARRRRKNEMTSRDWLLTHQRLPCRAGIVAAPTPNPAGPRRRDDELMMKLRVRVKCGMRNAENNQWVKCGKFSPEYSAFYPLCQLVVITPRGINGP